jgi:hypothetical protein
VGNKRLTLVIDEKHGIAVASRYDVSTAAANSRLSDA